MGYRRLFISLFSAVLLASQSDAQPANTASPPDPLAALDRAVLAAEMSLRDGEPQLADSRYRSVLLEGWMIAGGLHAASGELRPARDAFRQASSAAVETGAAVHSLALVHLQLGEAAEAVAVLTRRGDPGRTDPQARRLLAQALIAAGRPAEGVQALEEAQAASPDDAELTFLLATAYLHAKKIDAAERTFARVAAARPLPETYVLIGRTYRDFGLYDRARTALETALKKDPHARRAHYYLGTTAVMADGIGRIEDAIREFREELKLAPDDAPANLRLGMALVEVRRPDEALAPLERASRAPTAPADAFHYLGRCQLALNRAADAVASLGRALELSKTTVVDPVRVRNIHYQLALALRQTGATEQAAVHFAEAERASAQRTDADREQLARYLADKQEASTTSVVPLESPFSSLTASQRVELQRRVADVLARAYLNLGVMHAQAQRFARAAEFFSQAAEIDPNFPQVQFSLGVAYFNAGQHEKATAPLARALAADPSKADVRRMLALASLNAGAYGKTVELLASDPQRDTDASLQYAYALALVRSDRASEAEAVFARLLATHGTTPELRVLIGQAHAQQGDFDNAIESLRGALQLKPDVAEANATLGLIYLKQGKLPDARSALQAELRAHPGDMNAAHTLATVLDLEGDQQQAVAILRSVLKTRPDLADSRYLIGKILLARGAAEEAVEHLEAAARLAPDDANVHFQLAQAYRKLGRTELADRHFDIYRQIKDKRRTP